MKKNDGWIDEGGSKGKQQVACNNGHWGCGRTFTILRKDIKGMILEAENFNPKIHACLPCCNSVAHKWGIAFEDLDFLMTAMQNARVGKFGQEGSREEVLALLERMGVRMLRKVARVDAQLPAQEVLSQGTGML